MSRILVTDGEQRSALAIVRSLGRAGHEVMVCSAAERPLAGASRQCSGSYRVADPAAEPDAFRDEVGALLERLRIDVTIPATDVSAIPMLTLRDRGWPGRIAFPDAAAYRAISDKKSLLEVAEGLGLNVPRQVVLEGPEADLDRAGSWVREHDHRVVLKPARSAVREGGVVHRFGVGISQSEDDFWAKLLAYPRQAYPLLIQERIRGPGLGAFLLTRGGAPVASFAHRRIREKPPTGGVSVYRESVPLRRDIADAAERLLAHYGWTGVAMVEFKEDSETGTPYLMEVNGRFWGSLQLAIDAGVDFPALLVRVTEGWAVDPVPGYRVGVRSRWLWGDFDHLLWIWLKGGSHRGMFPELPGPLRAAARFALPWRPGDRYEVLRARDPGPFLRETRAWMREALGR